MRNRCYLKTNDSYYRYGGRGITVCQEWRRSFLPFSEWAKSNGYRSDKSIDRINPDGNYEPSNCRWATDKQQARNKSKDSPSLLRVIHDGNDLNLSEWSRKLKICYTTLVKRYNKGIRGEALLRPPRVYRDPFVQAVLDTKNGKAKLSNNQIAEIRASSETGAALAKKMKVAESTISMIRNGIRRV